MCWGILYKTSRANGKGGGAAAGGGGGCGAAGLCVLWWRWEGREGGILKSSLSLVSSSLCS